MSAPAVTHYSVLRQDGMKIGAVHWKHSCDQGKSGWRFVPLFQRQPSRKVFDTPEAAIRIKNVRLEAA